MDRSGALEAAPVPERRRADPLLSGLAAILKALAPWAVLILIWEAATAAGWSGATLFPPPSSFIRYAVESDFRVGFGNEAMTIPAAILRSEEHTSELQSRQ